MKMPDVMYALFLHVKTLRQIIGDESAPIADVITLVDASAVAFGDNAAARSPSQE